VALVSVALFASRGALAAAPVKPDVADALEREAAARNAAADDDAAIARLRLAFDASGRPSQGLALARALAKRKQLLAALAVYRLVESGGGTRGTIEDLNSAQTAASEADALVQRLARLRLLAPPAVKPEQLELDGRAVVVDSWLWLEPGEHAVQASAPGSAPVRLALKLDEGERRSLVLELGPAKPSAPAGAVASADAPATPKTEDRPAFRIKQLPPRRAPSPVDTAPSSQRSVIGSSQRLFGYFTIGWGVVGLLAGGTTLYLKSGETDADKASTLGTLSTIGFAAGGGLTALGIVLVVTAPTRTTSSIGPLRTRTAGELPSRDAAGYGYGFAFKGAF
jgi:hypothetical protein